MLTQLLRVKEGMCWFKSGHFYNFWYKNFENDPIPTVVMLNCIRGTHPNTGHYHNYIQCINLNYVPRPYRQRFVNMWLPLLKRNHGNVRLTWERVISQWPFMKIAVRRYLLNRHYIRYQREIPFEDVQREVVSTFLRDYSMSAMKQLAIINDRMRRRDPDYKRNIFSKSLSKYLYKFNSKAYGPIGGSGPL